LVLRETMTCPGHPRTDPDVIMFGKLAETCDKVKKGAKVLVDGRLDISDYTDKEGQKRMTFRILADTYRLL